MRLDQLGLFAILVVVVTACSPNVARENFAAVSGGLAQTKGGEIGAERLFFSDLPERANRDFDYDSAQTVGGRFGMWFNEWGGIALDGSYFKADGKADHNIVSVTPLLQLRARLLHSNRAPNGHLQPYFGIGPGIFATNQHVDFRPDISRKINFTQISVGVDIRTGMRWQLSNNFGVFGEYRLTHYKTDNGNEDNAVFSSEGHVNSTLTTNHFMGGLSFVF